MSGPKYLDILIGFLVLELLQYVVKLDVIPYLIVPDKRDPIWGYVSDFLLIVLIDYALRNEWSCDWTDVLALASFISAVYLILLLPASSSTSDVITLLRLSGFYSTLVVIVAFVQYSTIEYCISA